MSTYIPYLPVAEDGFTKPDEDTQLLLQLTYGRIMHSIKDALDTLIHEGAEETIAEFNYARHYENPQTHDLVLDYLAEMMDSPWAEDTSYNIARETGPRAPTEDIEIALRSIMRAAHARLKYAIGATTMAAPVALLQKD